MTRGALETSRQAAVYERPVRRCTVCDRSPSAEGSPSIWRALCRAVRLTAAGYSASKVAARFELSPQDFDRVLREHLGISSRRLTSFFERAFVTLRSAPPDLWPVLELDVPYRPPLDFAASLDILRSRAATGVEWVDEGSYRRSFSQTGDTGTITVADGARERLAVTVTMDGWTGLAHVVQAARHVLNIDADALGAARVLSDDAIIGPLVRQRPGVRPPGTWDLFEAAVKAVLCCGWDVRGQDWLGALVQKVGRPAPTCRTRKVTRLFPLAEGIVQLSASELGMPFAKAAPLHAIARAACQGSVLVDQSRPIHQRVHELASLKGVGPVTGARYAWLLGEADAYPEKAGAPLPGVEAGHRKRASHVADRWRPYRSFAYAQLAISGLSHATAGAPGVRLQPSG